MQLKDLPNGALIKSDWEYRGEHIIWRKIDTNHPGYPSNSVTLFADKLIMEKAFDAKEPNNKFAKRPQFGNNRYLYSNIRQWLNSDKENWYTAQHSTDQKPDSAFTNTRNGYSDEKGFLAYMPRAFKNELIPTTITACKCVVDGTDVDTMTDKIFLLSSTEVGLGNEIGSGDGVKFGYFTGDNSRIGLISKGCYDNSDYQTMSPGAGWYWWTRTSRSNDESYVCTVSPSGLNVSGYAFAGAYGVRPAFNLPLNTKVKKNADNTYSLVFNQPPTIETNKNIGEITELVIQYTVDDEDKDAVKVQIFVENQLEQTIDNVTLGQRQTFGYDRQKFKALSLGSHTAKIVATDSNGEKTEVEISFIKNNNAPEIQAPTELTVSDDLKVAYTITDAENDRCSVKFKLDGDYVGSRTNVTLGKQYVFTLDESKFASLPRGHHDLDIEVEDSSNNLITHRVSVEKVILETQLTSSVIELREMPKVVAMTVNRHISQGAEFKLEVSNNAQDKIPTWEDMTQAVERGDKYYFKNKKKTSARWGFAIRMTLKRGTATETSWVSEIKGNYE